MPIPEEKRYTPEEFEAMNIPGRCELINGRIYIGENDEYYKEGQPVDMSPSPNLYHQKVSGRLYSIIRNYIDRHRGKCEVFAAPTDVKIDESTLVPDLFVTCDPEKTNGQNFDGAPDWVIEILSPSNSRRDTVDKLYLYRESGVREYWIVDPMERRVIVYPFESSPNVEMYTFESSITAHIYKDAPEPLVIRLADYL